MSSIQRNLIKEMIFKVINKKNLEIDKFAVLSIKDCHNLDALIEVHALIVVAILEKRDGDYIDSIIFNNL
jgi:hypothetical protein